MSYFAKLDRFHQIGRLAQVIGGLITVSSIGSAIVRLQFDLDGVSGWPVDRLPAYNVTALVARHPLWTAAVSAPVGVFVLIAGTAFLSGRAWARSALQRLCWLGAIGCVVFGGLWALSLLGQASPIIWVFGLGMVGMGAAFAVVLMKVAREINDVRPIDRAA